MQCGVGWMQQTGPLDAEPVPGLGYIGNIGRYAGTDAIDNRHALSCRCCGELGGREMVAEDEQKSGQTGGKR